MKPLRSVMTKIIILPQKCHLSPLLQCHNYVTKKWKLKQNGFSVILTSQDIIKKFFNFVIQMWHCVFKKGVTQNFINLAFYHKSHSYGISLVIFAYQKFLHVDQTRISLVVGFLCCRKTVIRWTTVISPIRCGNPELVNVYKFGVSSGSIKSGVVGPNNQQVSPSSDFPRRQ